MSPAITNDSHHEPEALARMAAAFAAALTIAGDVESPFSLVPAFALRRRIAGLVLQGAEAGLADVDLLKAFALRGLADLMASADEPPAAYPEAAVRARAPHYGLCA